MSSQRFTWSGFFQGAKTIFRRNALLIIAVNILNQYGNSMKNGFRPLLAVNEAGVSSALLGAAVSVFVIAGMLCRAPAGMVISTARERLKYCLAGALALKGLFWFGFLLVRDAATLFVMFFLDGVIWSFVHTTLTAVLAMTVDRRAVGSAFAIMQGLTALLCASARSNSIALYNKGDMVQVLAITAFLSLGACLLTLCMKRAEGEAAEQPETRKRRRVSLHIKLLPLCLIAAMPLVLSNAMNNFFALYAEGLGMDYLSTLTLGGMISAILSIVSGFLCDIINPVYLIMLGMLGQVAAPLMWAFPTTPAIFTGSILVYSCTRFYNDALNIFGMKLVSRAEQGSYVGTMLLCQDLFSVVSNFAMGLLFSVSYRLLWTSLTVWNAVALGGFVVLVLTSLKKNRAGQMANGADSC